MADNSLVLQLTKVAFLIRLVALFLLLTPRTPDSGEALLIVLIITATSALGLWSTQRIVNVLARHPLLVVGDVLLASVVAFRLGPESPLLVFSLGTALLIGLLFTGRTVALLTTTLVSIFIIGTVDQGSAWGTAVALPSSWAVIAALASITRHLHDQALRELGRSWAMEKKLAHDNERLRLARDLHDTVSKTIHGIELAATALPAWVVKDPQIATRQAHLIAEASRQASTQTRELLTNLREDDRTLVERLADEVDFHRDSGRTISADLDAVPSVPLEIAHEIGLLAGEALENIRRHSEATHTVLRCWSAGEVIRLEIRDDGTGFDPARTPRGHFGVTGMRERAEHLGGSALINSSPGAGTAVQITIPLST